MYEVDLLKASSVKSARLFAVAIVLTGAISGSNPVAAECRFNPQSSNRVITYRFAPDLSADALTLHVTVEFVEGKAGSDTLEIPIQWAGEELHSVKDLQVTSPGGTLDGSPESAERVIHAKPGTPMRLTYTLTKDWTGAFRHPLQFHPVLTAQYLEFTGRNALVRLKEGEQETETVNFDWSQLPPSWALATSFGSGTTPSGRCQTHAGPWRSVDGGLYAAGDFRLQPFTILGQPAMLAVRGRWTFTDEQAAKQIQTIVGIVRSFWHDDHFPYFLVTLAPYDQEHGSSDGSQFTNAFWMFVSSKDSIDGVLAQLAHESFHAWDPAKMGTIPSGYDEHDIKWFEEGGTEYYAQLLTLRGGYQTTQDYVLSLNKLFRRFPESTDEYVRGRIISLWLDATIREESGQRYSLDDVMFDMVRGASQPFTFDRVTATINRYLSPGARIALQQAVLNQGQLKAPTSIPSLGTCAVPALKMLPTFNLGFDYDASRANNTVIGVQESGPAYTAGLRNGQKLLGYSVVKWDPDHLATFRISSAQGEQRISFFPRGKEEQMWQYDLQEAACSPPRAQAH